MLAIHLLASAEHQDDPIQQQQSNGCQKYGVSQQNSVNLPNAIDYELARRVYDVSIFELREKFQ